MSFTITVQVASDGTAEVTACSQGAASPPPGTYVVSGHVPSNDGPTGSVGVSTPMGGASGYLINAGL